MKKYILAIIFVEFDYNKKYQIVSANIGDIINGDFIKIKSLKINSNLLNYVYFSKKEIYNLQIYLNNNWNNKGLMLLDVRSENPIISILNKILINAHENINNNISSIICGVASYEGLEEAYKKSINHIEENNPIEENVMSKMGKKERR